MKHIEELRETLKRAREAYYNLEPIMADSEYDSMRDELQKLSPKNPEIQLVGASPPMDSVWHKVKHEIQMGSLNKVNNPEEFEEWANNTRSKLFCMTHKIDGASLELVYENGALIRGVTRGDGNVGEDITTNIMKIPSIPHSLPFPDNTTVRGEVVMFKDVFNSRYSDKYANPRNTASAKMREKKNNGKDCENMNFLAYWIKDDKHYESMSDSFRSLNNLGFDTPALSVGSMDDMKQFFLTATENRSSVPYDIDGMVVSVLNLDLLESLGNVSMRPKGQIAWKFDSEQAESNILDVVWQVGNTGRVCPVAKIKPVKIGGVTIESVSLHNVKMFRELKLFRGCRVLVSRRNDTIPYIESNLDANEIQHL